MSIAQQPVHIAVEGLTDEAVIKRILNHVGLQCGWVRGRNGKDHLLRQLSKYNEAAQFSRWLVVIDLDQDADCAPAYRSCLLPEPSQDILLRIPVRAIESWLLADRERIAAFLGIAIDNVPTNPDNEVDPKTTLIGLAKRSRRTHLREDIVPRPNSGAKIGPGYSGRIQEFLLKSKLPWRPEVARRHSDSLNRCIDALNKVKMSGNEP